MKLRNLKILDKFLRKHNDAKSMIDACKNEVLNAEWQDFNDIIKKYHTANLVDENKVVFNVKGNKYRLIVKINFEHQIVLVKFAVTHSQYDKVKVKDL